MNPIDVVKCNYKAAQYEEEVNKQARVDDEKVVVKNRFLECIVVVGNDQDSEYAP
ncbi:hypothetical protein D3C87_1724470 [compost metagenome]